MISLGQIGISREDRELMENRLFPGANKIFLQRIASQNGYDFGKIQGLNYENHPVFVAEMWDRKRVANSKLNKKLSNNRILEYDNFDDAKKYDKKSNHILLNDEDKKYHERYEEDEKIEMPELKRTRTYDKVRFIKPLKLKRYNAYDHYRDSEEDEKNEEF